MKQKMSFRDFIARTRHCKTNLPTKYSFETDFMS